MNSDSKQDRPEVVIINPGIWKQSKLTRSEFLRRIRCVREIRVEEELSTQQKYTLRPVFSYFPRTLESWSLFERLHGLVNQGDFAVFDERTDNRIFAITLPAQAATWLLNTRLGTIQRQILNWLAAWTTFHATLPDEETRELPSGIREQVEAIKSQHYSTRFNYDEMWNPPAYPERPLELLEHYQNVSKVLTNAAPPEILSLRKCELDDVDWEAWGFGSCALHFPYRYAFFRADDWERIVLRGEDDEVARAENCAELWQKWLHTFELYPTRKSHLFRVLGTEVQMGFVYIFRGVDSGRYKIGFTGGSEPYARQGSLQTGSVERLEPVGHFRAASIKTETVVKNRFVGKLARAGSEWFALSADELANLLDEDWRIRNNIF